MQRRHPAQVEVPRLQVARCLRSAPLTLRALELGRHGARDSLGDLVLYRENIVDPPIVAIGPHVIGRFRFNEQKKQNEARKKQKTVDVKEIKVRPGIDDHDYDVKMRAMKGFFEEGNKVKVTLRFRGREMAHQGIGLRVLDRIRSDTADLAKVEAEPNMEGRQVVMVLAPR